jgi:hypothetical protein
LLPTISDRQEKSAIAALLLVLLLALVWQAWWLSITVDEPSHLLSAYLYWHGRDRLYPRDMPPLIKIVGGWPTRFMHLPVPDDLGKPGDTRLEWQEASDLIRRLADRPEKLNKFVFFCRLPLTLFPLLTAVLLWRWARRLFSPAAGVIVAALWCFCPTAMGHGALFKNDHAAAFTYLLFWFSAWRFWRDPTWRAGALLAASAGLAALSKNSMLFLLAIAPVLMVGRSVMQRDLRSRALGFAAVAVAVPWLLLNVAYGFEPHWVTPAELTEIASRPKAPPSWFLASANVFRWVPIPEGLWIGVVSLFASNAAAVPVYMLGQIYPEGHRLYFIAGTVLKMVVTTQLLFIGGLAMLIRRGFKRATARLTLPDLLWIGPGLLYFALASMSSLHLGVRLVLPAWAFFVLIAGVAVESLLRDARGRAVVATAVGVLVVASATVFPNGLSYFNPFVGGSEQAIRYLADSNIDWAQSTRDVAAYARDRSVDKLRFAYFGFDVPQRYFPPGRVEFLVPPWNDRVTGAHRLKPEPGWYAISASLLPGHFFLPEYREYYAEFRARKPVAVAGGSVFIYRVD